MGRDRLIHGFEVARELPVVVMRLLGAHIPAVVAKIEHHQFELIQQKLPKRKIAVGGKAVAVAEKEADVPGWIAVLAHMNNGPVVHGNIENAVRGWKLKYHQVNTPKEAGISTRRIRVRRCG